MQKKVTMILVGGLVACLMGGCGQSEVGTDTMATVDETIAENTEVTEEVGQVEESTKEGDTKEDEETVSDSSTDESVEENGEDETVEGDEFPVINEYVLELDNSDEYGVYSTSCYDLDQYLDDNGALQGWDDFESSIHTEYSGRWAYPVFTPCKFFTDLEIIYRDDALEILDGTDIHIEVNSGYGYERHIVGEKSAPELMFTAQTADGEIDVIHVIVDGSTYGWTNDGYYYFFKIASFEVKVRLDHELDKEEVQLIIDNIRPTSE